MNATEPRLLLRADAACGCLDFNAGEYSDPLPNHVGRDGHGAPADQVCGAACQAELHRPAGAGIGQLADLITEKAQISAAAEC